MRRNLQRISWMMNRLSSMEPAEFPFRLREWWRMKTSHSWKPPSISNNIFHSPLPKWPTIPDEIPHYIHRNAELIIREGVELLGVKWTADEVWKWGWDPRTGSIWPQIPSHDIELRFADADIKPAWELLKLQHLQILAWSAKDENPKMREKCLEGLKSWLDWDIPFHGIGYSSGIECACRIMSLIWISSNLDLPVGLQRRIWCALYYHASWIIRFPSRFSSANNHRIAELSALIILGRLAPKSFIKPERWEDELIALLPRQQYCDGVGTEQSMSYQALCMEWLLYVQHVAPRIRESIHDHLSMGAKFLVSMMDRCGNTPQIGDHDNCVILRSVMSRENSIESICGAAAHVVQDTTCIPPSYVRDLRLSILGLSPQQSSCIHQSMHFPKGGYTVLRNTNVFLVMDHGPLGFDSTGGHGHADALSLWMHYEGKPIWIDWGMYRYNGKESRRMFARSTQAHNTVQIGNRSQSVMSGPFNWSKRANSSVSSVDLYNRTITAQHDGYDWIHQRKVSLMDSQILIEDSLIGDERCTQEIEICFWLEGTLSVQPCPGGWFIFKENRKIASFVLKDSRFRQNIRDSTEHGVAYNQMAPAIGLYWNSKGVQEWKIEWKWLESI